LVELILSLGLDKVARGWGSGMNCWGDLLFSLNKGSLWVFVMMLLSLLVVMLLVSFMRLSKI
jgi:hypothetical protein